MHRWQRRHLLALAVGTVIAVSGCSSSEDFADEARVVIDSDTVDAGAATTVDANPTTSATTETPTSPPVTEAPAEEFGCRQESIDSSGRVERTALIEASGLAAGRDEGLLWAHNDSAAAAGIYGFDLTGADRGYVELVDAPARDIEDMAIVDGTVHLADIGDNLRARDTVAVHIFDEPPSGSDTTISEYTTVTMRYPDGPTDAEAFLVDPRNGQFVILGKNLDDQTAPTRIYTLDPPFDGDVLELSEAGALDVAALTARSTELSITSVLFPGSVTGADITPDADLVALRTYGSVWLFPVEPDQSLAEALASEPCEGAGAAETQGEAVAFITTDEDRRQGLIRYATVGEGLNPAVNLITVSVQR